MSTNDVPGANPDNCDELKMGCWAEADDGSLIFVMSTETGRVVYAMYDVSRDPIIRYDDAMIKTDFEQFFSWNVSSSRGKKKKEKWTWHDKTPFPFDRIIKRGFKDGPHVASAEGIESAARRVAESLKLRGKEYKAESHEFEREVYKEDGIKDRIQRTINEHAAPDLPSLVEQIGGPDGGKFLEVVGKAIKKIGNVVRDAGRELQG